MLGRARGGNRQAKRLQWQQVQSLVALQPFGNKGHLTNVGGNSKNRIHHSAWTLGNLHPHSLRTREAVPMY